MVAEWPLLKKLMEEGKPHTQTTTSHVHALKSISENNSSELAFMFMHIYIYYKRS